MLGVSENKFETDSMLTSLDLNGDGTVDLWEFCVYIQKQREQVAQATDDWAISQAFELFQTDSDGCINVEEVKRVLGGSMGTDALDDAEMASLLQEFGLSADGKIKKERFSSHPCWADPN